MRGVTYPVRRGLRALGMCVGLLAAGCHAPAPPMSPEGEGTAEGEVVGRCVGDCTFVVVAEHPHDRGAFTQGLTFEAGQLYEGTGLNGRSSLRQVDLATGQVIRQVNLDSAYFGEGIEVVGNRIYQLTWRSNVGFIYDLDSFEPLGEFQYPTEGWGLCFDGTALILSDGTHRLHFHEPETFARIRSVAVTEDGARISKLNELEFIDGFVWANIWQTNFLVRIDPVTGEVVERINLTGLLEAADRPGTDVLNGIALDEETGRLYVTGKLWPKLFELRRARPAAG
jgi:glutamine cyclotransferase